MEMNHPINDLQMCGSQSFLGTWIRIDVNIYLKSVFLSVLSLLLRRGREMALVNVVLGISDKSLLGNSLLHERSVNVLHVSLLTGILIDVDDDDDDDDWCFTATFVHIGWLNGPSDLQM